MEFPAYSTKTLEYFFYFPKEGMYSIYPANVSRDGLIFAVAKDSTFKVMREIVHTKYETMEQIMQQGTKDDILKFAETRNLLNSQIFRFSDIYYLLVDKDFYLRFIQILRTRKITDKKTWSFSIYHHDIASFKEYLELRISKLKKQFRHIDTSLLKINRTRFYEYYPLINHRFHILQESSSIMNNQLREQYREFMEYLVELKCIDIPGQICYIYYLLL